MMEIKRVSKCAQMLARSGFTLLIAPARNKEANRNYRIQLRFGNKLFLTGFAWSHVYIEKYMVNAGSSKFPEDDSNASRRGCCFTGTGDRLA